MSSYSKNINLSERTKRRRIKEELNSIKQHNVNVVQPSTPTLVSSVMTFHESYTVQNSNDDIQPFSDIPFMLQSKSNDIKSNIDEINEFEKYYSTDDSLCEMEKDEEWNENNNSFSHFRFLIIQWAIGYNITQIALNK